MKKFLFLIIFIVLGISVYFIYNEYNNKEVPVLNMEEHIISVDKLYTYGTHLNILGSNVPSEDLELVLYDGEFIPLRINVSNNLFNISNFVNDGFYLDNLSNGYYYLFLRSTSYDEDGNVQYKYYPLKNNTEYENTVYYTMSNYDKKITINTSTKYSTMAIKVEKNDDPNIYDIVLDAGHGGRDPGAVKNGYSEIDFTLDIALNVKSKLEEKGIKVKLTRDKNTLSKTEKLPEYGVHGRAVIPGEVKAKYLFSFHLNSSNMKSVNGIEIYAPVDVNYDFAKLLVKNIVDETGIKYSNNKINRVFDGIYSRTFTSNDIKESNNDYLKKDLQPYDITTKTNYYYIIRETGGIVTGAYVDSRNPNVTSNPNYNTNTGTESYLLELGYMTSKSDLNNMINHMDKYVNSISSSILTLYEKG